MLPKSHLLQSLREKLHFGHFSRHTEEGYVARRIVSCAIRRAARRDFAIRGR